MAVDRTDKIVGELSELDGRWEKCDIKVNIKSEYENKGIEPELEENSWGGISCAKVFEFVCQVSDVRL